MMQIYKHNEFEKINPNYTNLCCKYSFIENLKDNPIQKLKLAQKENEYLIKENRKLSFTMKVHSK